MFTSKLFLLWLSIYTQRIAANSSYPRQFTDVVLKGGRGIKEGFTECLKLKKNRSGSKKFKKCLENLIYVEVFDFYLYRKCSPKGDCLKTPVKIHSKSKINNTRLDFRKKLVVIVHGAAENYTSEWQQTTKQNLLDNHDVNVLMMDWRSKEHFTDKFPRSEVVLAGIFGGKLVDVLRNLITAGLKQSNIHLVGNGLGAQIAAFAGKYLKKRKLKIGRISGLDPVGMEFNAEPTGFHIHKEDAEFVDCIFVARSEVVMSAPVCQANVYSSRRSKKTLGHSVAMMLFAESVIPSHKFSIEKCEKFHKRKEKPEKCKKIGRSDLMGYPASNKLSGIFKVKINKKYPFSMSITDKNTTGTNEDTTRREIGTKPPKSESNIFSWGYYETDLIRNLLSYGNQAWNNTKQLGTCLAMKLTDKKSFLDCLITNFLIQDCDLYMYHKNKGPPLKLSIENIPSLTKNINKKKKVVFLIHGVTVDYTAEWLQKSVNNLLRSYDVTVFAMDWRSKLDHILMASFSGIVPLAMTFGRKAGEFILALVNAGWDMKLIHVIGHSLGGQIASFAGKTVKKSNKILPRITAMDPAGLSFDGQPPEYCLDKDDAKYVDCIFTSSPILSLKNPVCTANFYANCYGEEQPGTYSPRIGGSTAISHLRAGYLFAESILPAHKFVAKSCKMLPCQGSHPDECVELKPPALMGYPSATNLSGIFYVKTRGTYPFSLSVKGKDTTSSESKKAKEGSVFRWEVEEDKPGQKGQ